MANPNHPYQNASNAAQYAGYSHFYATPQAPQHQQRTQHQPRGPPPVFARPPPPPGPGGYPSMMQPPLPRGPQWAAAAPRGPPPPPPPPRGAAPPPRPQAAGNPWQWGTQSNAPATVVASAPPVMYNAPRGPAPRPVIVPAAAAAPIPAASTVNSTKWPDSLHDYVKRAFARCKGAADQSITQNALKELISTAIMTNTLWTKNWHAEPLPTLVGDTVAAKMVTANATRGPMGGPPPPPVSFKFHQTAASTAKGSYPNQSMQAPRGPPGAFIGFNNPPQTKAQKRKAEAALASKVEDLNKKSQRKERFLKEQYENAGSIVPSVDPRTLRVLNHDGELDLEAMTIKGTSRTIEKEYLRLTSPPHPSTVRPEPILRQALEMVKTKWKTSGACDYIYACSQLKSIRQDCTVQRIKNEFTVQVYETHARVALESGDINEFNQCQTQLHELYEKAIPGQAIEFLSYRILYCIYVSLQGNKKPDSSNAGQLGMYSVLASVTPALREHESVRHALAVREAVATNHFHRFFKLHAQAPKMAGYLMDPMVTTIRLRALRAICKAYRPNVPIDLVRRELSLEGKDGDAFIAQSGIVFVAGSKKELVDTKSSDIVWVLSSTTSSLI